MFKAAYHLRSPKRRETSVVFASPHSACDYPAAFLARTLPDALAMRSSEDAFVDRLFAPAPDHGAPLLLAGAPRAFVDLNRSADELDPALIEGARHHGHNPRIASGLGVIPRVVAGGRVIYDGKLSMQEARKRIDHYWRPYHAALTAQMDAAHKAFGNAVLIDCHSMPHEALDGTVRSGSRRPDVVLGDRFGASASREVTERIEAAFTDAGLSVARNTPFAGAYITQTYGRPPRGRHAVQIEIDRALYMDERSVTPNANFEAFAAVMADVIARLADIGRPVQMPLAAE
ncbi:N-formylglutamate amidohydrolase [Roseovarius nanhaiticus]|uniref:N-formylglutamate amidohydrolase n=1 Tax=Roseovarius nanhaiticus TaxID=573024 RepID=UPI00248FE593|nr:N-formylglutamate amidohydrolase [Roseovarius nanhaiticus]